MVLANRFIKLVGFVANKLDQDSENVINVAIFSVLWQNNDTFISP